MMKVLPELALTSMFSRTNKIWRRSGGGIGPWLPVGEFPRTLKKVEIIRGCLWVDGVLYVSGGYSFSIGTESPNAQKLELQSREKPWELFLRTKS
jgi:hypothetical protein